MNDLAEARELVRIGDYDSLEFLYDDIPDTLSQLIRTAFIARSGYKFYVADFSAIEARVIAHLAGESWRAEVFKNGGNIYCASASQMFHVPVEKHGINGHLRQKGKIAELALGYGGSVGALKAMGALEMDLTEDELGIRSMGAYLRKMPLHGYCINLDLQDVKALVSLLRICSNNLNQYAKRANETGSIYEADINDLQVRLEEIWTDMKEVLVRLSSIQ